VEVLFSPFSAFSLRVLWMFCFCGDLLLLVGFWCLEYVLCVCLSLSPLSSIYPPSPSPKFPLPGACSSYLWSTRPDAVCCSACLLARALFSRSAQLYHAVVLLESIALDAHCSVAFFALRNGWCSHGARARETVLLFGVVMKLLR